MKVENIVFALVVLGLVGIGYNTINAIDHLRMNFEKAQLQAKGHSYEHLYR